MSPTDPFTWDTLRTIGGASLACVVVPNVLGAAFKFVNDRARALIALVIALAIQITAMLASNGAHNGQAWTVASLNGFLVAATALGLNQLPTNGSGGGGGGGGAGGAGGGAGNSNEVVGVSWLR